MGRRRSLQEAAPSTSITIFSQVPYFFTYIQSPPWLPSKETSLTVFLTYNMHYKFPSAGFWGGGIGVCCVQGIRLLALPVPRGSGELGAHDAHTHPHESMSLEGETSGI